jgi:hypothetical protein
VTVFRRYKHFRNEISLLSCDDALNVIWAYSQYLSQSDFRMPADIEVSKEFAALDHKGVWITQWDLEILAKEVILNARDIGGAPRTFRQWDTLAIAINALKEFENKTSPVNQANILIELNRMAHRQFTWQENAALSMLARHYKIFNTPAINGVCKSVLDLSVDEIYLCGIAFLSLFLQDPYARIPIRSELSNLSNELAQKFLGFVCRPIWELRSILQLEQRYDDTFFYAYNSLRQYPVILMPNRGADSLTCPLPTLLIWRFTAGLYYELVGDPGFANAFGSSFEKYVGEVMGRSITGGMLRLEAEQRYGTKKARKHSVDWIIVDSDAAIFIECKAKRPLWDAKSALNDLDALHADLDHLANAIVQLYKTIADYRAGAYKHFPFDPGRTIFPVVLTLENWHIFLETARKVREFVVEKLSALGIPLSVLEGMPYSIWCINDLEAGIQVIDKVGIRAFMERKILDPEMSQWEWQPYLAETFRGKFSRKDLLRDDYDALFEKLILNPIVPGDNALTQPRRP